jgi:hypothetical protein
LNKDYRYDCIIITYNENIKKIENTTWDKALEFAIKNKEYSDTITLRRNWSA